MSDLPDAASRPVDLTIQRATGLLRVQWADGHQSAFALAWLRAHCPCATCREERRTRAQQEAASGIDLRLHTGPPASDSVTGAELVGAYALRLDWSDGHNSGIYPFAALRRSCPCAVCNPGGAPPLLPD